MNIAAQSCFTQIPVFKLRWNSLAIKRAVFPESRIETLFLVDSSSETWPNDPYMSLQKGWHAVSYSLTARKTIYTFQHWRCWLWLAAIMLPNRISEEFMYPQYPEQRFTYQANLCYNIIEVVKSNSTSVLVQLNVIALYKCAGGIFPSVVTLFVFILSLI